MKIAIISNREKLSGRLTRLFTGCYAYHVMFVDEATSRVWDMHFNRRRQKWPIYKPEHVALFDCPVEVTPEFLEGMLETDRSIYGWQDYILFAMRPIYHLFGASTRNADGIICSEMINADLIMNGWDSPWPLHQGPPSPCDMLRYFSGKV